MIPTVLAVLVVVITFPLNWYITWRLWRLSKTNPELTVLGERVFSSLVLSSVVTVFAAIFLHNSLVVPPLLTLEVTQVITRLAILGLSIPAIYWWWLYRNGRRD